MSGNWVDIVGRGGGHGGGGHGGHARGGHGGHRGGRGRGGWGGWGGWGWGGWPWWGGGWPYPYDGAVVAPGYGYFAGRPVRAFLGAEAPTALDGAPFPPRAALVEHPAPTQADRWILPMSTGVPILPTQSAQITGRPQAQAYQCNRFVISNSGTSGGAADWIVNDIKVGNQSQFVQSGDVPGDMFATNAIDTFVRFQTAQTAMDVVVVVTYIGLNESGVPFFGAMLGTAAV